MDGAAYNSDAASCELPADVLLLVVEASLPEWRGVLRHVGRPWRDAVAKVEAAELGGGASPMRMAEIAGRLALLEWAAVQGCPMTKRTCAIVVSRGGLESLRWCREQAGCPWDATACAAAAAAGDLASLRYCREHGCTVGHPSPRCPLSSLLVATYNRYYMCIGGFGCFGLVPELDV